MLCSYKFTAYQKQPLTLLTFSRDHCSGSCIVTSPSSVLNTSCVCLLQVVPYWGNTQERKIMRKFWDSKWLHTQSASFHVVITSYQLVIQDVKYFQRINWQYLVLDEAQAIKSTSRSVEAPPV